MQCRNHPDRAAAAICQKLGTGFCAECCECPDGDGVLRLPRPAGLLPVPDAVPDLGEGPGAAPGCGGGAPPA